MMMARGRGGAIGGGGVIALVLLVGLFVATSAPPVAEAAASYMVGDYGGWKFNVDRWAKGRTFRAGDVLVFSYNRAVHDVAVVNAAAYRSCAVPNKGARVLRSGRDKVRLGRGTHYFACTVRGHCQAGMKLAVRAV
ncbi:Chemocyanin precursor [Zea mays]|uniref:Plantacyanin n=2 Tax=Zea mays TaxID=4577 RepID=C0PPD0_MAIZE|nr:Chemocyanin precursor [Zea mays]ACN37046.1 unknown [Zea mays]AQK74561.1 Basic blue protein [Zea mays]